MQADRIIFDKSKADKAGQNDRKNTVYTEYYPHPLADQAKTQPQHKPQAH